MSNTPARIITAPAAGKRPAANRTAAHTLTIRPVKVRTLGWTPVAASAPTILYSSQWPAFPIFFVIICAPAPASSAGAASFGILMYGDQTQDFELFLPGRRHHAHRIARGFSQQRPADRRGRRNPSARGVGFFRGHQLVFR